MGLEPGTTGGSYKISDLNLGTAAKSLSFQRLACLHA